MIFVRELLPSLADHLNTDLKGGTLPNEIGRLFYNSYWIIAYDSGSEGLVDLLCTRPSEKEDFERHVGLFVSAIQNAEATMGEPKPPTPLP